MNLPKRAILVPWKEKCCDQIFKKICTPHIRERLLIEPELKTITLVRLAETAMSDAKTFIDAETKSVNVMYKQKD